MPGQTFHNTAMKALYVVLLALLAAGCATPSKYAKDPRASVVGPAYLDAIAEYPRDEDTQRYYPVFMIRGFTNKVDYASSTLTSADEPRIDELLTRVPEPTPEGAKSTGKGWRSLEHTGIPFFPWAND